MMNKGGKKQSSKLDKAINEEFKSLYNKVFIEGKIFDLISEKFDETEYCKAKNIDADYFEEMYSKISPLIDQALKEEPINYNLKVQHEMIRIKQTSRDTMMILSDLYRNDITKIKDDINDKKKTILNLIFYFFLIESIYSHYLDIIIFTLTSLHHDYCPRKTKYITEFSDIRDTRLYDKLNFLNHHGLEILTTAVNRELRNSIAHSDFTIDDEGRVNIVDKNVKVELKNEINNAIKTLITLEGVIQKCESEFMFYALKQVERIITESSQYDPSVQDESNNNDV